MIKSPKNVATWTSEQVRVYLQSQGHDEHHITNLVDKHKIDGRALLLLTELDLREVVGVEVLGDMKRLYFSIVLLQKSKKRYEIVNEMSDDSEEVISDDELEEQEERVFKHARNLKPEFFKALVAMAYLFVVTWITALVMVIVHDRVPDMEKYPPLPDLFLDNMPHIPWAFEMCEVTGTILLFLWFGVLFFHKHRFILVRRFFALSGTVFLLRCFTMLITSLSVPGAHLKCNPRPYGDWMSRLYNAYLIWRGAGMSIQGVRTCGDYMFSGHTVALTMLNFFVTEYTTRRLYFLHTLSWLLNMFGIFFILAAHEHYSIDVFIAFYITSRLFLYYHTLSNNQALWQRDSKRTKVWFPLFSYFESGVDGIVPNSYEWPITPKRLKKLFKTISLTLETKYKSKFFTRTGSSRGFGLFRIYGKNAFIRPTTSSEKVD